MLPSGPSGHDLWTVTRSGGSHFIHTWHFRARRNPRDPSVSRGSAGVSVAVTVGFEPIRNRITGAAWRLRSARNQRFEITNAASDHIGLTQIVPANVPAP
jgi:hypothetical protein